MDGFDNVIDLIGRLYEVVVILKANDNAMLFPNIHTGLDIAQHPVRYLFLGIPLRFCRACKNPDDRGTHFGGHFNPFLDKLHVQLPFAFIRYRKIISNAGSTDLQTETERFSFYMEQIIIRGYDWIALEIVAGDVHSF